MSPDSAPLVVTHDADIPAATIAADQDTVVTAAPFDGTVTAVRLTPEADVTGDDTDTRVLTLVNRGDDGTGTTVIATLDLATGTDLAEAEPSEFVLSAVAHATEVVEGDVLIVDEVHAGAGLAHSGGLVEVEFTRA